MWRYTPEHFCRQPVLPGVHAISRLGARPRHPGSIGEIHRSRHRIELLRSRRRIHLRTPAGHGQIHQQARPQLHPNRRNEHLFEFVGGALKLNRWVSSRMSDRRANVYRTSSRLKTGTTGGGFAERSPHNSLALLNANDDTRRVFSSRIKVRVTGGSARWLQFSRSHSRQLTPIGVPSAFSRSMPAA